LTIKEQDERGEQEMIAQVAERKGKMEVAKRMKDRGMPNEGISDLTGLRNAVGIKVQFWGVDFVSVKTRGGRLVGLKI